LDTRNTPAILLDLASSHYNFGNTNHPFSIIIMFKTLYMDGLTAIVVEFAGKEDSDHWIQRMDNIKEEATSIVDRFSRDTVERRKAIDHWLGRVSGALEEGMLVVPSILKVRQEFLSAGV